MKYLISLLRLAELGDYVAVIGKSMPSTCIKVGHGMVFFRNHSTPTLKTIRVDTVWFVDYPPPAEVEELGRQMLCLSKNPAVLKGNK